MPTPEPQPDPPPIPCPARKRAPAPKPAPTLRLTLRLDVGGRPTTEVAEADAADVNLAVAAARRAFEERAWAKMKPTERAKLLWRLSDLMEAHGDELAELESLDNGKPITVARAADIPFAIETFRYMAGWVTKVHGQTLNSSMPASTLVRANPTTHPRAEPTHV